MSVTLFSEIGLNLGYPFCRTEAEFPDREIFVPGLTRFSIRTIYTRLRLGRRVWVLTRDGIRRSAKRRSSLTLVVGWSHRLDSFPESLAAPVRPRP